MAPVAPATKTFSAPPNFAHCIAREWLSRGKERDVVLVGTERGIEMKLVPQAGLPLETLRVAGLKGKGGVTLLKNLSMLAPAMLDARRVLRKPLDVNQLVAAVACWWPPLASVATPQGR